MSAVPPVAFRAHDPSTGRPLEPDFHDATRAEVEAAVAAAAAAAPTLAAAAPGELAALLDACADAIDDLGDALVARATAETGYDAARIAGERARTTAQLRAFGRVVRDGAHLAVTIDHADPTTVPPTPDLRRTVVPLGPVAVFGASNFPLAFGVAGGDTASALAAGCPVVAKAHPSSPGTSALVAEAMARAVAHCGLPAGTFTVLQGAGHDVGRALVTAEAVAAVGFTGSLAGGRALFDLAAARPVPIPVYAEMGSHNPVWVLPVALAARGDAIASALAASATLGSGQFCTKPGLVFLPAGPDADRFVAVLAGALDAATVAPLLDRRIARSFRTRADALAALPGVARATSADDGDEGPGWHVRPSLLVTDLATWRAQDALREECFGPLVLVVLAPPAELVAATATVPGGLAAAIHGDPDDDALARDLIAAVATRVGRVVHGGFPTGVAVAWAQQHGGPYPATTAPLTTSVGARAIDRFLRPVTFQDVPEALLPEHLRDANPWRLPRRVDGALEPGGA